MSVLYTTHAHVAGGRSGAGRTDDGQLDVTLARPVEMGGPGGGTNPEQLFAVGYAACFEGALGAVARRRKIDLGETSIDSMISLVALEDGTFRITAALDVDIPLVDDDALAVELVEQAHLVCPYSNALRGNVDVALSANGVWVAGPVAEPILDPTELRRAFTLYPRGVMAVASMVDGSPVGLAVSAFVSVSLEPPLMLICIDRASSTWPKLENVSGLGVSVIAEEQAWLGRQLASRRSDRFAGADFEERPSGALLLAGAAARFETTIEQTYDGGDHLMVLLRVVHMEARPDIEPLVWYDSQFAGVASLARVTD